MRHFAFNIPILLLASSFLVLIKRDREEWQPLLDEKLTKWETYLSYPHKVGYKGERIMDEKGLAVPPIGYRKNTNNVFSISKEGNQTVLRISGEIYGCVFTKKEFKNYHLKLKVKWGSQKWVPRLNDPMDSGILYHSQGECGVDYWRSWMLSQEFQVIENSMGDYWSIANSQIDIPASMTDGDHYRFDSVAGLVPFGLGTGKPNFCQSASHREMPNGNWNDLELICFEDKSLHVVNGQVVMALENSRYLKGEILLPLTGGRIQLQSEAAEVFFKEIYIRSIDGIPEEYTAYFSH